MIYLLVAALVLTIFAFIGRTRTYGLRSVLLDTLAAVVLGWLAGLLIGIGARIGMWSIPFFNATESHLTPDGTLQVVLVFSLYGIALGIMYELLFRALVRNRGLLYGVLITLLSSYPLAAAAIQQLSFTPSVLTAIAFTLIFVGLMFIPFAVVLELFLARWHRFRDAGHLAFNRMQVR